MNYKFFSIIIFTVFLSSCENVSDKTIKPSIDLSSRYSNTGFALVYKEDITDVKKLDSRS